MADRPGSPDDDDRREDGGVQDAGGEPALLGAAAPVAVGRGSGEPRKRRGDRRRTGPARVVVIALVGLGALVLLALGPSVASGLTKTPPDRIGISYGGGPFEGSKFQRIVEPGSSLFFNGFFDPLYLYPADQQNYIISKTPGVGSAEAESVQAPSADRVLMDYQVAVYFKLNTDLLQQFHEQLGLKYRAFTAEGWNNLLQDTFRQQIEAALQEESRRSDVADLYGDAELLIAIQDRVQATLSQRLRASLGAQFFCAPTFEPGEDCGDPILVVKTVGIPEKVALAFESNRTSQVQIETKNNEVLQREAEARGINALSGALAAAGDQYVLLRAIESGKIGFWVLPGTGTAGLTLPSPDVTDQPQDAGGDSSNG